MESEYNRVAALFDKRDKLALRELRDYIEAYPYTTFEAEVYFIVGLSPAIYMFPGVIVPFMQLVRTLNVLMLQTMCTGLFRLLPDARCPRNAASPIFPFRHFAPMLFDCWICLLIFPVSLSAWPPE